MFTQHDRLYVGFWGFIIGDALGVPYEFLPREMMKEYPATGMTGWGTHDQPPGTWSDDSSMMLCVLLNRIEQGTEDSLAGKFLDWYQKGAYTAHGEMFDIGHTTRIALERAQAGISISKIGLDIPRNAGNGALMRSLPYAFITNIDEGILLMYREHALTHHNTLSHLCCTYYVYLLRQLSEGRSKEEAKNETKNFLLHRQPAAGSDDLSKELNLFHRLFALNFQDLPEDVIHSSGYVLHTLEAAVWCFLNSTSYKEAVLKAVNLGGDTDTISAITGSLAAVYYNNVPSDWKEQLAGIPELKQAIQLACSRQTLEL